MSEYPHHSIWFKSVPFAILPELGLTLSSLCPKMCGERETDRHTLSLCIPVQRQTGRLQTPSSPHKRCNLYKHHVPL